MIKFCHVLYHLQYLVLFTHSIICLLSNSFTYLFPHLGIIVLILFFAPRSNKFSYSIYEPHHYDSSVIPRIAVGSMMILFTVLTHSPTHSLTHSPTYLLNLTGNFDNI